MRTVLYHLLHPRNVHKRHVKCRGGLLGRLFLLNNTDVIVGTTSVLTGVRYDNGTVIVMVDEQRRSEGRLLMPVDNMFIRLMMG